MLIWGFWNFFRNLRFDRTLAIDIICEWYFTDLIEIVPDLVWIRTPVSPPTNILKPEPDFDQNDYLLESPYDLFSDHNIPHIRHNLKDRAKNLKILKKHLNDHHFLPLIVPGSHPSIIWTTVVVSIIHLLFEFFRWKPINVRLF